MCYCYLYTTYSLIIELDFFHNCQILNGNMVFSVFGEQFSVCIVETSFLQGFKAIVENKYILTMLSASRSEQIWQWGFTCKGFVIFIWAVVRVLLSCYRCSGRIKAGGLVYPTLLMEIISEFSFTFQYGKLFWACNLCCKNKGSVERKYFKTKMGYLQEVQTLLHPLVKKK